MKNHNLHLPTVEQLLEDALNAACLAVQKAVGQEVGDLAGIMFSGSERDEFFDLLRPYCEAEIERAIERIKSGHQTEVVPAQADQMTGLMLSVDDGLTWQSSSGVRVMYHDATEGDDESQDLLVNVTTEGIILDVIGQQSGEVDSTASLLVGDLVDLTS